MTKHHKLSSLKVFYAALFSVILLLSINFSPKTASADTSSLPSSIINCQPDLRSANPPGAGQEAPNFGLIQPMCEGSYYEGVIIAGREVSLHASERMVERKFDKIMVESILNYGKKMNDTVNKSYVYVQKGGSGQSRMVATTYNEAVIKTVMIGYPPTTVGRMRDLPY